MTTETRLLPVNFTVPIGLRHTWLITHQGDICALTGVQGEQAVALSTGRFDLPDCTEQENCFAKSCFQDWLAESIQEMRGMCKEEL